MVNIFYSANLLETERIMSALEESGIVAMKRSGSSDIRPAAYTGMSMRGYDIFVDKDMVKEAREIIAEITGLELYVESDGGEDEEEKSDTWWVRITPKMMAQTSIIIMGLGTILCFIAYFVSR